MHFALILVLLVVLFCGCYATNNTQCPPLPDLCRCNHKRNKNGLRIKCSGLKYVNFTSLPNDLNMDIDLSVNQIESLDSFSFPHPNNIRKLNLRDNKIKQIAPGTFKGFRLLRKLDLSQNDLNEIPSKVFTDLRSENSSIVTLNLGANKIISISPTAFYWLSIDTLVLSNQQNLYNKQASLIAYKDFLSYSYISNVKLENNRLLCDCTTKWLLRHSNKILGAKCYYPEPRRGQNISQLAAPNEEWKNCDAYNSRFYLPQFHMEPSTSQIYVERDNVIISCQATFFEQGYWLWDMNGVEFNPSASIEIKSDKNLEYASMRSTLIIKWLNTTFTGNLSCKFYAETSGSMKKSTEINVLPLQTSKGCSSDVSLTERGAVVWPATYNGAVRMETCPHGGGRDSLIQRECVQGNWSDYRLRNCYFKNILTRNLQKFYFRAADRNTKTIFQTANAFSEYIQTEFRSLNTKYDFYYLYKTLFEIMKTYQIAKAGKYSRFFWGTVALVTDHHHNNAALDSFVDGRPATWRFRHLLEEFMTQESAGKASFSIKHQPTIASVSMLHPLTSSVTWQCYAILSSGKSGLRVLCPPEYDPSLSTRSIVEVNSVCSKCASTDLLHITSIVYLYHTFFKTSPTWDVEIISPIIGLQIRERTDEFITDFDTEERTLLTFRSDYDVLREKGTSQDANVNNQNHINPRLVYWKHTTDSEGGWQFLDDCKILSPMKNTTQFECYISSSLFLNMVYFSLAVDVESAVSIPVNYMEVVLYIGASLAALLLFITLVVYTVLRQLRYNRSDAGSLMNLCLALLISEIFFASGFHRTDKTYTCKAVAVVLQYFLLVALLWLACAGTVLIRQLKRKYRGLPNEYDPVLKYYLIAWGLPSIVCSITFAYDRDIFGTKNYCWLRSGSSLVAFIIPAGIILIVDVAIFCYLHVMINRCYPPLLEAEQESEQEELIDRDKCNSHSCKYKIKPFVPLEQRFPLRYELMCYMKACLLVIMLLLCTFVCTLMSYETTKPRYLYLIFCYGAAISNFDLALTIFYYHCIKRKHIVEYFKELTWFSKPCQFFKVTEHEVLSDNEDQGTELQPPVMEVHDDDVFTREDIVSDHSTIFDVTHGVYGMSDHVQSDGSVMATTVRVENSKAYEGRGESNDDLNTSKKSSINKTPDCQQDEKDEPTKVNNTQSELSGAEKISNNGQNSIGDCSLTSSRRTRPKVADIPENLKAFVPENWRPVKRRGKSKGASYYPYYLNESAPITASAAYSSKSSSIASTTVSGVPLYINKKRAANNLAMYNDLFKQNMPMNNMHPSLPSPGLPPNIPMQLTKQTYSHPTHPMVPSPAFTQKHSAGLPITSLNPVQEQNTSSPHQSLSSCQTDLTQNSRITNNNVELPRNAKTLGESEQEEGEEVEEAKPVAPMLYVCMPHVSIKQFQPRSETSV